jgi:hypothetical protein
MPVDAPPDAKKSGGCCSGAPRRPDPLPFKAKTVLPVLCRAPNLPGIAPSSPFFC